MANVYAVKSGNWSDTTVWNTGALPTVADDVWANTFTITIDISPTVLSIRNGSTTNVTIGGFFQPTNGITLTCTATNGVLSSSGSGSYCFNSSLTSGQSCTVSANCIGSGVGNNGAGNTGTGTLNIVGNAIAQGANGGGAGVINGSTGTVNITGNCIGPNTGSNSWGAANIAGGTMNITGICIGGFGTAYGAINSSTGVLNVTGTITTTDSAIGVINTSNGTINFVGTATSAGTGVGIVQSGGGVVNITGTVIGGTNTGAGAANVSNTGSININGTIRASNTAVGYTSTTTGPTILTGPFICASNGVQAVSAINWRLNSTTTATYTEVQTNNLIVKRNLYTPESIGGNPSPSNVRAGVLYGPNSDLLGTCIIPPVETVQIGIPVDNTFGTMQPTINSTEVWNAPVPNPVVPGSVWEKILSLATVSSVGDQIAAMKQASN